MSIEPITITYDGYLMMTDSYDGICLACGEICEGGCEPDAMNYECFHCGEYKVMGAEFAMMSGHIEIEE